MKAKPPAKYDPRKVKLTSYEQSIENAVDKNAIPATDPALLGEVRTGLAALATSLRGGKRPGSGRKPRETRRTMVLLSPAARTRLEELATETGSLSAAVEKAVMAFPH
jgi:hypothetical protein